jgi:hypothetical protein
MRDAFVSSSATKTVTYFAKGHLKVLESARRGGAPDKQTAWIRDATIEAALLPRRRGGVEYLRQQAHHLQRIWQLRMEDAYVERQIFFGNSQIASENAGCGT